MGQAKEKLEALTRPGRTREVDGRPRDFRMVGKDLTPVPDPDAEIERETVERRIANVNVPKYD